jgi:cbb3-type cytochrome oxidase subunit 3
MEDWAGWYKFARLAALALVLVAIAVWLFRPKRRERLERPARRMLEDDDE